jgi:cytochrome c oxidase subunit 2
MQALGGPQSAANPQGVQATAIADIGAWLFIGGGVLFVGILCVAAVAAFGPSRWRERMTSPGFVVYGGVVLPLLVLTPLLVYSLSRMAAIGSEGPAAVRIEVEGRQWWWHVRYLRDDGSTDFVTANEIRIPAGQPVDLELRAGDVIHSFWVPALAGKLDMIPGSTNRLRIQAEAPGSWRGQCAEFCGGPHAWMAFRVVAEATGDYERWLAQQRTPARAPGSKAAAHGQSLFLQACAACHAVRGTPARGTLGPDLTHVGSRMEIAAGTLPNNRGTLAAWIASSQHVKPENLMPSFEQYAGPDLRALVEYLSVLH